MSATGRDDAGCRARLDEALADYMERLDRGEAVDRPQFLAAYADLADDLRQYFADSDEVEHLARRDAPGGTDPPTGRPATAEGGPARAAWFGGVPPAKAIRPATAHVRPRTAAGDGDRESAEGPAVPPPAAARYRLARVYALAAKAVMETARPADERRRRAERYAARAVALLAEAWAAGFFQSPAGRGMLLRDVDLDPLRPRDDFQRLFRAVHPQE
jgi:hypothetical protein